MITDERYDTYLAYDVASIDTVEDLREFVQWCRALFPEWREGQAWANCTARRKPTLANRATGVLDPYYDDDNLLAFTFFLGNNWKDSLDESSD